MTAQYAARLGIQELALPLTEFPVGRLGPGVKRSVRPAVGQKVESPPYQARFLLPPHLSIVDLRHDD